MGILLTRGFIITRTEPVTCDITPFYISHLYDYTVSASQAVTPNRLHLYTSQIVIPVRLKPSTSQAVTPARLHLYTSQTVNL